MVESDGPSCQALCLRTTQPALAIATNTERRFRRAGAQRKAAGPRPGHMGLGSRETGISARILTLILLFTFARETCRPSISARSINGIISKASRDLQARW